jgi:hypothetical protein
MNADLMEPLDEALGCYSFLPWLSRGLATEIIRQDDGSTEGEPHALFPITVWFNDAEDLTATVNLAVFGPGEVVGIDQRLIIRVWPTRDANDAETTFFPAIEFRDPDFPWRYTPARAGDGDHLRPWLCLIVLADGNFMVNEAVGPSRPFPSVTAAVNLLPVLLDSWAWAHVQVSLVKPKPGVPAPPIGPTVADLIAKEPHRVISRLIYDTRAKPLTERTAYTAFLVPAFERGRLKGLGKPVGLTPGLKPAWPGTDPQVELPIYYRWRFQTGAQGDFASLASRLTPHTLADTVGVRPMDVSEPGLGLPTASTEPLKLEGALMSPAADEVSERTEWNADERRAFIEELRKRLNHPQDLIGNPPEDTDRKQIVAPPLYGRWHAAKEALESADAPEVWFQELNSDPRLRVSAGLGTQVVRTEQRQLMAGAWRQVGEVIKANEILRQARLGCECSISVKERHIGTADTESLFALTASLHSRVLGVPRASAGVGLPGSGNTVSGGDAAGSAELLPGPKTIRASIEESPIAEGALDPAYRRIARPRGPLGRRQGRMESRRAPNILGRMNRGEFSPAPIPPTPQEMATPGRIGKSLVPEWCTRMRLEKMSKNPTAFEADLLRRAAIRDGTLTSRQILRAPGRNNFIAANNAPGTRPTPLPPPPATGGILGFDNQQARDFRNATAAMLDRQNTPPAPVPDQFIVLFDDVQFKLTADLDPTVTIPASAGRRINLSSAVSRKPVDSLEPILAAPSFDQPMYESLRDLSQEWLLPGVEQVPANTVSLLVTNQRFIEAYMVGLNHEMARELLYNEYPTDQRGSYFRQFWEVAGSVPPTRQGFSLENPKENLRDIHPIHRWGREAKLGENGIRKVPLGEDLIVLLVRGDLLLRYPNTIVYAARASRLIGEDRPLLLERTEELHPIFRGTLKPDISFFGFDLTETKAKMSPGWFFVLQEPPTEPRFKDQDPPIAFGTAAEFACKTLADPVRVAIHASDMLKKKTV